MKVCSTNKPKLVERSSKIEYILNKYYNSLLECIEENPKYYKDAMALAVSDPKELTKAYTLQLKQLLATKTNEYIEKMFEDVKEEEDEN